MHKHFKRFLQSVAVIPALTAQLVMSPLAGAANLPTAAAISPDQNRTLSSEAADNQQQIASEAAKINTYLGERNSPLVGYGQKFAEAAEENGLPYTAVVALSVVESGAGANPCPADANNVFGWDSCHGQKFSSIDEAIDTVASTIGGNSSNPKLVHAYKGKTLAKVFSTYNGRVNPDYVGNATIVMDQIANTDISSDQPLASVSSTKA